MEPTAPTSPRDAAGTQRRFSVALLLAILALVAVAGQWYDSRHRFKELRQQTSEMQMQLAAIEDRLRAAQDRQSALESLYQELSRSSDQAALAEVEQTLLIADQQLQIAGNVKAALAALQAADTRLARSNRPELTSVRNALAHDIEHLRRAPTVDVAGISAQLAAIRSSVVTLPLAVEKHLPVNSSPPAPIVESAWRQFARTLWQEFRSLIRIQNAGQTDMTLLAPEQDFFLRENLKLRLLDARLALLAHDEASFKADLTAAQSALMRYFAADDPAVAATRASLQQLAGSRVGILPPDIAGSLAAVRDYRLAHETQ